MALPSNSLRPVVHVVGASGRSGQALVRSLMADGITVVAVVRDALKWHATGLGCEAKIADLKDPQAMRAALNDAEYVVSCAHAGYIPAILKSTPTASRFVFLGSTRKFTLWPDDHGKRVLAGEASFLASGRNGVILHPTMIYGATGENNVQRLVKLLRRLPVVPLPNNGEALVQPIYQEDVTNAIRAALDISWNGPNALVIAGPKPLRYADFVRAVAAAAGIRHIRILPLPLTPLIAMAWIWRLIPGVPKVRPAELRRLSENKDFDIRPMQEILKVRPRPLTAGLARMFTRSQLH